ncbi:MAG: bifunctional phosphoribosylaminoimidazolecarboxamide formyltransferase/IMP cyclohydrolase [bacterium]|nr:bifunctional phosphoribosylaminoimidazolecarboxamide formyltransferase/IMP cyclohydrolase [bacterium]
MVKIRRVLISVSDKRGIIALAEQLNQLEVSIISTGGTANVLKEAGIPVTVISDVTKFPEILEGRVKTLHPAVHGGILAKRSPDHLEELGKYGIEPIDMVVVNLYPFAETVRRSPSEEEAIENIDIGGPTMIRAAAKNYKYVASVVNPARYEEIITALRENGHCLQEDLLFSLAREAFAHTAAYDALIANYFQRDVKFPETLNLSYTRVGDLRYGENPHQQAAFYRRPEIRSPSIGNAEKLWGKELSYNNLLDLDAGLETVREFDEPAAVVIKHNNPCGVARGDSLSEAYLQARECDPVSAFGGVVGLNQPVDTETARRITETFIEAVLAPDFTPEALEILQEKRDLRIIKVGSLEGMGPREMYLRQVTGGLLVQDRDLAQIDRDNLKVATQRQPTEEEIAAFLFGWKVVKHVKSNAIILVLPDRTVGIGAGQMSRIDSTRIAIAKAGDKIAGAVLVSDAFFPFRDNVDEAAKAGIKAIIQPGGSVRDEEVIKAADEHNMAMVFTGRRHFRH